MFVFLGEEGGACCLFPTSDLNSERVMPCATGEALARLAVFFPLIGSWSALAHSLERGLQLLG